MAQMEQADAEAEAGPWREAQAEMAAEVDPEALTVMASIEADFAAIDDNLARAQACVAQQDADAGPEATAAADPASSTEADMDADLEI